MRRHARRVTLPPNKHKKTAIVMKVLLCAIAKEENHYLREWVEWYKNIGVDHICLYDNNNPNGERFEEVINDYIREGFVEVYNYRGRSQCQKDAYNECYARECKNYDWLMFLDIDELLFINKSPFGGNVKRFLSQPIFDNCNGVKVNWKCMTDGGKLRVEDGDYSMFSRFKQASAKTNFHNRFAKTIVRGGLNGIYWTKSVHHPADISVCDVLGNPTTCKNKSAEPLWKNAIILHYRFKTIEEYVTNKMRRLYADHSDEYSKAKLSLDYFFEINDRTSAKEEYAKELLAIE